MRTNIVLNEQLTQEALLLTGAKSKRDVVELALRELVKAKQIEKRKKLTHAFTNLHKLQLDDNPFPEVVRQDRPNPFADEL